MKFVVDTSIFTNPDIYQYFGELPDQATRVFFELARQSRHDVYLPRSIKKELDHFITPETSRVVERGGIVRSPNRYELFIPSALFYEFVDEMRVRIDKGLRVAERAARTMSEEDVRALREQYRDSLRHGIIDSKEDMDVILLAKEVGANVISADEGVNKWADKMGLRVMDNRHLRDLFAPGSPRESPGENQS